MNCPCRYDLLYADCILSKRVRRPHQKKGSGYDPISDGEDLRNIEYPFISTPGPATVRVPTMDQIELFNPRIIIISYLKPHNCEQIICIRKEYLKPYKCV